MGQHFIYFLIALLLTGILWIMGIAIRRAVFLHFQRKHRMQQARDLRFLQVQIPKNAVARSSDIDAKDHIQSMKQNIELMNQVYKNFYAIFEDDFKHKWLGNNAISMEILVEKEVIKFLL